MRALILDTNSLIHFRFFTDLPWSELFDDEKFSIVLPHPVIKELDKHKISQKENLQNRARKILSNIQKIRSEELELPSNLSFDLFLESPSENMFSELDLNQKLVDDQILASCKLFEKNVAQSEITLITADYSLLFKAESIGIDAKLLDDRFKISLSNSKKEEEINKLKKEVSQLKNTIPNLEVVFPDGNKYKEFVIEEDRTDWEKKIQQELEQIKNEFPKIDESYPSNVPNSNDLAEIQKKLKNLPLGPTQKPPKKYNQELEEFYDECEEYLKQKYNFLSQRNRSFIFQLQVKNTGTAPAKDTDILLHFPDGFLLFEPDEAPISPPSDKPEPPSRKYNLGININSSIINPPSIRSNFGPTPPSNTSLDINKTNSYDVNFHIQRLKHNQHTESKKMVVLFDSYEDVKGFTVEYKIQAANVPNEISGELNFAVKLA